MRDYPRRNHDPTKMEFTQVQQYVPPAPLLTAVQLAEAHVLALPIPQLVRQVAWVPLPEIPPPPPLVRHNQDYDQFDTFE